MSNKFKEEQYASNGVKYNIANGTIMVNHENGYHGHMYKSYIDIWYKSKQILRAIKIISTPDELYELLSKMPKVDW